MSVTSERSGSRLSCSGGAAGVSNHRASRGIGPLVVSTRGLPPRHQFEAWRDICVPYLDMGRRLPSDASGFDARGAALPFGAFMHYHAILPPYDYSRSTARIRRDSLDHWIIGICRRGTQRQRSGDVEISFRAGVPYVLTMAQAFEARREGAEIEWNSLFVARDAVPELEPMLSAALCTPLDGPTGSLLASFLATLQEVSHELAASDLAQLDGAAKALLATALGAGRDRVEAARPQMEHLQLARIKRLIRSNLASATLGPARLCALGGLSRSALYRLFEPLGGVARCIQRERLLAAYRALTDPSDRRSIARLAEEVGFFEPSSFSRAFRGEFGTAPRELRAAALAGAAALPPPAFAADARGAPSVSHILRRL